MKSKNFLSNLWSLLVGSRKDDGSTRLRVDYDSFTCRLRVWPLKLVSVLVIVLSLGSGNVWATDYTLTEFATSFKKGSTSGTSISAKMTAGTTTVETITASGSENWDSKVTAVSNSYYSTTGIGIRISKSKGAGTFKLTLSSALQDSSIYAIVIHASKVSGNSSATLVVTPTAPAEGYTTVTEINNGTLKAYSALYDPLNDYYKLDTIFVGGKKISTLQFGSASGGYTHLQRVSIITQTEKADVSCTTNPIVTAGSNSSVTATTATVSCSSGISSLGSEGCRISSYGFVIGTSGNPSIGGSGVTKHEVGTSYTTTGTSFSKDLTGLSAETTYNVRPYATNGNGTAYGTQTSFTTPALPKYTVTWKVGGSTTKTSTVNADTGITAGDIPSAPADDAIGDCANKFMGWSATELGSGDGNDAPADLFTTYDNAPYLTGDLTLHAVFATSSGGGSSDFTLVTDVSQLQVGDIVTIANFAGNSKSGFVIKAYTDGNNWPQTSATTDEDGKISERTTDMQTFTLEKGNAVDTWAFYDGTGYPCAASSEKNYMKRETSLSANSSFAITIAGSSSVASVVAKGSNTRNIMRYNGTSSLFSCYSSGQNDIYIYRKQSGSYSNYKTACAACANNVTVYYTAAPAGGTVAVTKSAADVASGTSLRTCEGAVVLTVTLTPAEHYSVTNLTATGVTGVTTTNVDNVYTVTIPQDQSGTLNLKPTFTEDAHIAINWNVNGSNLDLSGSAAQGLTWVYSGGDITALPSEPSVPAGCSGTKVFAGWSTKHSDATEQEASWYDDLFTAVGDAPTGITSAQTYYAVFATSSSNPLAGEVMWAEDFGGFSEGEVPNTSYGSAHTGTTVYNSGNVTYACTNGGTTTKIYAANFAGGTSPEILVSKSNGQFDVTGIPTSGQTELTLTYKCNKGTTAFEVSSATGTVTVGDASVEGSTYTRTITISQPPSATNSFALTFKQTTSDNARLDDIHLVVPGSGTMTDYVTLCAPSWTITYDKNTTDPVTNLPSPTSVLQSTGSGTLSATVPTRATYTFGGWATTAGGAKVYDAGDAITGVTADKTLYAVWTKTPIEEINLNYHILEKYVDDDAVTLAVTSVIPDGADMRVTWSSDNSTVASVVAATGVVTFGTVGKATITATSTVTGTTTAVCNVTVRNKPTATFVDLIHNGNGTDLSTYDLQNVAGTSIVFPTLSNTEPGAETCEDQHYIFVGWTTSDNNDDPQDRLVTSDALENDVNKTFYAVWADGKEGYSYTQLTSNSFEPAPTKYVIGVNSSGTMYYFNSCANTGSNNSWGYTTNDPTNHPPIQFTLSGTASELIATSTEAPARYIVPMTTGNFRMSTNSQTLTLNEDGTIHNTGDNTGWTLRGNSANLRWYSNGTGNPAYFYKVEAGSAVSYRTSCCANPLAAPSVTATSTAYTVTLTWDAVADATGYEVSWNGGAFEAATSPCVKSGLTASTTYTYKVRATYNEAVHCGARVASGNVTTDDVYSVIYSGGTGTGSCSPTGSVATVTYEAGETVTLAATNSYGLTSNNFAAWVVKDAENNDVAVSNNQFRMPASNVTVTATWTAVQDKYYDRMHQSTDASHGGIADGNGKYYIVREGCNYTVPSPADDKTGDTDCHTTHYKLLGWIAQSHLKSDGSIKDGEESYLFQGGTIKPATGATYYAIYAIMTE